MYFFIIAKTINLLFVCYTAMLMIRIFSSWVPNVQQYMFVRFVSHYTDPYLNVFRKRIPPIGGVFDLSPILAFLCLRVLESIIMSFLR